MADDYERRVLNICGSSLIGYWPLDELSGVVAYDHSGNNRHGTYTGADLAAGYGVGRERAAPYFDGANDWVDVYSAGLAAAFNPSAGSLLVWLRVPTAGTWTDGVNKRGYTFGADASNYIQLRTPSDNTLTLYYAAGGVTKSRTISGQSSLDYLPVCFTWDAVADEIWGYIGGVAFGAAVTGLGTWSGTLSSSRAEFGNLTAAVSANGWLGYIAHAILCGRVLTPTEIRSLSIGGR